jgi:hypothetical protein
MIEDNEFYVVVKLVSGENVLAILRAEDEDFIMLESPMCIKTIPNITLGREHVTAAPLCQFSDDKEYVIDKKNIMFCKKLHHVFIAHYKRIVAESEEMSMINQDEEEEKPQWTFIEGNETIN